MIRLLVLLSLVILPAPAAAHEWYTDKRNPVTNSPCCNTVDCFPVGLKPNELVETRDEYIVFKFGREFHFRKSEAMPSMDNGYHACIWGGPLTDGVPDPRQLKARCFFHPPPAS
jgi:hypothetical protein